MKLSLNKNILRAFPAIAISFLIFTSCNSPDVVDTPPPFLEIIEGPNNGEILDIDFVTFAWRGSDAGIEFKYRLLQLDNDNFPASYLDWTDYSNTNEVTFESLDESKFKFEVVAKSGSLPLYSQDRIFEIDAIRGPSLMFFKTETNMLLGSRDSIGIWMEDIDSLQALKVVVAFDTTYLNLVSVNYGDYVLSQKFDQIIVPDYSNPAILNSVNNSGKLEINTGILATLATLPTKSISGSGNIVNCTFEAKRRGTTNLLFTLIEIHKEDGRIVSGNNPKNGIVNIQ